MEEPNESGDKLLRELLMPRNNSSNVTFAINAGGAGLWVMVTAGIVMFCMNIWLGFLYIDLNRKLDRVEDYQNTTYALIPNLRQEVEKIINERKKREQ